jgi:hypothetical protein
MDPEYVTRFMEQVERKDSYKSPLKPNCINWWNICSTFLNEEVGLVPLLLNLNASAIAAVRLNIKKRARSELLSNDRETTRLSQKVTSFIRDQLEPFVVDYNLSRQES